MNWKLKIDIKKEMQALKEFTKDMQNTTLLDDDFIEIAKKLEEKFKSYEEKIIGISEDDGTWEDLENELDDFVMSYDLENANYSLNNIYNI